MIKTSASIVLYNTSESVVLALIDLLINSCAIHKIYLIDNSFIPDFKLSYKSPLVEYIHTNKNIGYGSAHNIAIKLSLDFSKYHFVINPDILFNSSDIAKLISRIDCEDDLGLIMPKVIYPDGKLQYLCKLLPTPSDLLIRRFLPSTFKHFLSNKLDLYELRFSGYDSEMVVPCLSGCFMLLRVSALRDIGLFDERYFMYAEDFDISRRLHSKYKTIFYPNVTVVHEHAKESYRSIKMLFIHMISIVKYFNKWGWFYDAERSRINAETLERLGYK